MQSEQLAYEEAKRSIDRQSTNLDGLRTRAGILLAAIGLVTTFLGGQALADDHVSPWMVGAAIVASGVAGALCVAVLWPRGKWKFNLSAREIITHLETAERTPSASGTLKALSLRHELNYEHNDKRLQTLFWLFRVASGLLAVEIILWIVALGT